MPCCSSAVGLHIDPVLLAVLPDAQKKSLLAHLQEINRVARDRQRSAALMGSGCDPVDPPPYPHDSTAAQQICAETRYANYLICLSMCPAIEPACCVACYEIFIPAWDACFKEDS